MKQQWACIRSLSNYESETSFVIERAGRVRPFPNTIPNSFSSLREDRIFVFIQPADIFRYSPSNLDSLKNLLLSARNTILSKVNRASFCNIKVISPCRKIHLRTCKRDR